MAVRATFPWLLAALLAACAGTPRAPIRRAVILPFATERLIQAALVEASEYTITGTHLTAGTIIERYTRADGLEVIYVPDPEAELFTLEAWWAVGWCNHEAPGAWASRLAVSDLGHGEDPALAGWRGESNVGCALSARRLSARAGEALGPGAGILAKLGDPEPPALLGLEARMAVAEHRALLERTGAEIGEAPTAPALIYYSGPHGRAEVLRALLDLPAPGARPTGGVPIGSFDRMLAVEAKGPPLFRVAWRIEDGGFEERLHLEALTHLLADGPESRLGRRLGPGFGSAVRARSIPSGDAIELEVLVSLDSSGTSTQALERIQAEIGSVAKGETTGLELERVKAAMLRERLAGLSSLTGRGRLAASALLLAEDLDELELGIEGLEALEETALRRTIALALVGARPGLVISREPKPPPEAK